MIGLAAGREDHSLGQQGTQILLDPLQG